MYELRGGPLDKGDKILIHTSIGMTGQWAERNETVWVDYLLPDYGKIIVKRKGGDTAVLYYDQENFVWDRL